MAIKGSVNYLGVERIITSPIEHHCVEYSVDFCRDNLHVETAMVKIDGNGNVDLEDLENLLKASDKKTLVTLMHANNEIGTLLDIEKAGALSKQYHALFHSDTVQTFAHFPIDVQKMNIDFLSGAAHKFHGPKGIGFLYMRKQNKVQPFIHGGGQERGFRAGTENVYGIVGMAAAAKKAYANLEIDRAYILELKNYFITKLKENFPDIDFNGNIDERSLFTVLNVSFPPNDKSALLLFMLDMDGICCSGGSACGSGASAGSHVINALHKDENRVSIRFSFSKHNTKEEVDYVIEKLRKIFVG
jgi:cysteine desulfurase